MSPELQERLFTEFPALFVHRTSKGSPMCFGIECGDGWFNIIRKACWIISRREERPEVEKLTFSQVKEKFGGLRLYASGGDSITTGIIMMAESVSDVTCEQCGCPGTRRPGGWIKTLCDSCNQKVGA